jgi:hypothetical protein
MTDDPVVEADPDAEETDDAAGGAADRPSPEEIPAADQSLVPPAAVKPLANAVVFVAVWSAMVVYTGRDLVTAIGLGVVGGVIYFLASYYLQS